MFRPDRYLGTFLRDNRLGTLVGNFAAWLTVASIVLSGACYLLEVPSRSRASVFNAWNIVTSMEGKSAEGGRAEALRELIEHDESLAGVVLDGAILDAVDLSHTDMRRACLIGVEFNSCLLSAAKLSGAKLDNGVFRGRCDFANAYFDRASLRGASFADARMDSAVFYASSGDARTVFNNATMKNTQITRCQFRGAIFDNADATGMLVMSDTDLSEASFQRTKAPQWKWATVQATGAHFEQLVAPGATFGWGTVLTQAQFDQSHLHGARFDGVNLREASFFGADVSSATFLNCDLSSANFTSASLLGARFINCTIDGTRFDRSAYDPRRVSGCRGLPTLR